MQIVVNSILTHYEDLNPKQKNTLIVLHGWGSSTSYWIPTAKLISPNIRVIVIDLPGFGSTQPLPGKPDVPEYTEFVKNFTEKLKLSKYTLVGHSFGGQIATDFALKFPKNLSSLVLVAPAAIRERTKNANLKIKLAKIIKPFLIILPKNKINKILELFSSKDYSDSNPYQKGVLRRIVIYDLKPFLNKIQTQTHIIWGSEDFVIPYTGKVLAESIQNSSLHVIYGAGHLIHHTHSIKLAHLLNQISNHDD